MAEQRVQEIAEEAAAEPGGGSISVGLAELRDGETLGELAARGDAELLQAKSRS